MNKQKRHLSDGVLIYAAVWAISYIASLVALKSFALPKEVGIILTVITALAFAAFVYKYYSIFLDEVQIKVRMEAVVIAFSLGLLLLMVLGLLDLVLKLNKEDWGYRHLVIYFVIFYFIGLFISKRKYNIDNEEHD